MKGSKVEQLEELETRMHTDLATAQLDNDDMPDEWKKIKVYLEILQTPDGIIDKAFDTFK